MKKYEYEMETASLDSPNDRRETAQNPDVNQAPTRPYADRENLNEIPRVRPDDPPMRKWWTDDEPQQDRGSQQNG
jgi:hypothetical protein